MGDSLYSSSAIQNIVQSAVNNHLNALFVQVRARADAAYRSSYEPRAEFLDRAPRNFDPLALIITEAHSHGIEVHAWLNTFLTWSSPHRPYSSRHIFNSHRDWFAADRNGNFSSRPTSSVEGAFLQPSNPAVQQHLFNVFTEVASKYDVDGIHFDYCRYAGSGFDFHSATLHRFREYIACKIPQDVLARVDRRKSTDRLAFVHAFGKEWANWRRAQITTLVSRISVAVKAEKPWMIVSAAVFPDPEDAFNERGQNWEGWLKMGALDAVALMAYNRNTDKVVAQTRHAVEVAGDKQVYTGIGAWRLDAHDVARKISLVRLAGASGVNIFSYGGVHNRPNYLNTLARGVFASRAKPLPMRWLGSRTANPAPKPGLTTQDASAQEGRSTSDQQSQ